jgi:biotin carboxyl carrier protein
MRYGNQQPEAPTHLGSHQLPLPPEWLPAEDFEDDDDDGPTRAARARSGWTPNGVSISGPTRQPTERSASPLLLDKRVDRPHPDDLRREAKRSPRSSPTIEGHRGASRPVTPRTVTPGSNEERQSFVASGEVNSAARLEDEQRARRKSKEREARRAATPAIDDRDARRAATPPVDDREARRAATPPVDDRDARRAATPPVDDREARRAATPVDDRDARRSSSKSDDRDARRSSSSDDRRSAKPSKSDDRHDKSYAPSASAPSASAASQPSASRPSASAAAPSHSSSARVQPGIDRGSQPAIDRGSQPGLDASRGSQPEIDPAVLQAQQAAALAAMGAIDPLAVPVPPELGGPIYSWIRRLALQADLLGADKVLREAFTDLTSCLSVAIVYPGADGLWTLGNDDEIPKEATPLVAVAQARRAMVASHTALIPVVTSTETVAVILLTRNPRNPGFHPIEQVAMVALARESAAILHHLAVAHLQRASEIKADSGGLYRGEALEAHRTRGNEGVPVNLSPSWIKRAYPLLVVTILLALLLSIFITVPTYSSGTGVVILAGTAVTAPMGGTVDRVLVRPGQQVKKGTILVRLNAGEQDAELRQAQKDADSATVLYLYDQQDEMTKKTLTTAMNKVEREKERVESRLVRAPLDGTVSDIRVHIGSALQNGEQVLQIVDPKADPEIWTFLPAKDRPRLRPGQDLQVGIIGYTKSRDHAKIFHVSTEAHGQNEAAKIIGSQLADAIKLPPGSYVWVRAKLPKKTFTTQHNTWFYHHGMVATTEVKIQSKPFLVTLLPAIEKYIPD